jgi:twinkle protein
MRSMIEELNEKGIRLPRYENGNYKTLCPRCSSSRKNKKDPCLSVTIESPDLALYNCHNCYWDGRAGKVHTGYQPPKEKVYTRPAANAVQSSIPKPAMDYLINERKLSLQTITDNKLFWDTKRSAIGFPYYQNGELVNVKYRTLDKKFQLEKGAKLVFYGLDDVKEVWNSQEEPRKDLYIVEGEFDKLTLAECGIKNVLSVPNGAPPPRNSDKEKSESHDSRFDYLANSEDLIKQADRVIIAVDNDKAGNNLKHELARRIGIHKVWVIEWPETEKDANECLKKFSIDDVLHFVNRAKPYPINGLYSVSDFTDKLEIFFNDGMSAGVPTGWETLDRIYTVMPAELTVVTGIPNSGKSEWLDALMVNLAINESWKFAIFSPENGKEGHVAKLVEKMVKLPSDPKKKNRMTLEQFMSGAGWLEDYFKFIVADDEDNLPTLEFILDLAKAAVYRFGIKGLVIDPWNEIEHQKPIGMNDTDYVSMCLSKIKRFAKNHQVHVWVIAHPTKITADKDNKTRVPSLYDISGSANWANKADNGIVIYRAEDITDTTEVWVKKVRFKHVGKRGMIKLKYDKDTGTYTPLKDEVRDIGARADDEDVIVFEAEQ